MVCKAELNLLLSQLLLNLFVQAVDTIHLEIFDERAFAVDDRIAWTDIVISPRMLDGTMTDTIDDWYVIFVGDHYMYLS